MMDICPEYANIEVDGVLTQVDPDEVEIGTIIVVQPGERIPLDGVVIEGGIPGRYSRTDRRVRSKKGSRRR